jgi:hypothetical protein
VENVDDSLPSARWIGFYVYTRNQVRHRMDLQLTFKEGRLSGTGGDDVGPFLIAGRVHEDRRVNWVKTYRTHEVLYAGHADHNGIWGTWAIPNVSTGGFRIWPASWGEREELTLEEAIPIEEEVPAVAASPAVRGG